MEKRPPGSSEEKKCHYHAHVEWRIKMVLRYKGLRGGGVYKKRELSYLVWFKKTGKTFQSVKGGVWRKGHRGEERLETHACVECFIHWGAKEKWGYDCLWKKRVLKPKYLWFKHLCALLIGEGLLVGRAGEGREDCLGFVRKGYFEGHGRNADQHRCH